MSQKPDFNSLDFPDSNIPFDEQRLITELEMDEIAEGCQQDHLRSQLQKNLQMIYNVKRFKQMMQNQESRRKQQQVYGGTMFEEKLKKGGKNVDFAKLVQKIDWMDCDVVALQKQLHIEGNKDDEKITRFHQQRQNYYKQLSPRKGVFKTNEGERISGLGLQTIKVEPKEAPKKDKEHEDMLHALTNATQLLLP